METVGCKGGKGNKMSIIDIAKNKGIVVDSHNDGWRVKFGDNVLFDATNHSSIERFLDGCELVEEQDTLALRVNGFLHFRIKKSD